MTPFVGSLTIDAALLVGGVGLLYLRKWPRVVCGPGVSLDRNARKIGDKSLRNSLSEVLFLWIVGNPEVIA